MGTNKNIIEIKGDFQPSCIRLSFEALERINELQAGGTDLTKVHTDQDFQDDGINDLLLRLSEVTDFIIGLYKWKMDELKGTEKADFAFSILNVFDNIDYVKFILSSLRSRPRTEIYQS